MSKSDIKEQIAEIQLLKLSLNIEIQRLKLDLMELRHSQRLSKIHTQISEEIAYESLDEIKEMKMDDLED
jgi:hypothetical protein